jgi:hypothetical protein
MRLLVWDDQSLSFFAIYILHCEGAVSWRFVECPVIRMASQAGNFTWDKLESGNSKAVMESDMRHASEVTFVI